MDISNEQQSNTIKEIRDGYGIYSYWIKWIDKYFYSLALVAKQNTALSSTTQHVMFKNLEKVIEPILSTAWKILLTIGSLCIDYLRVTV